jgi:putative membrane protein
MASAASQIKRFVIGSIVGIASMLPGVSGAVIAVCFGIYERLIEDLANLKDRIRSDFVFIFVIGLGIAFGMGISAVGLDFIMDEYLALALFFFLGLIAGQIPEIWSYTAPKAEKFNRYNIAALIAGILIMGVFLFIGVGSDVEVGHNLTSYIVLVFVGIILAVSKIAPGISGSTLLLALGLYGPMLAAITDLDWALILPLGIGLIIGLLGFAKIMDRALKHHRKSTYSMILGLTLGSLLVILSYAYPELTSATDAIGGIITFVIGIAVSLLFVRIGKMTPGSDSD